MLVPVKNEKTVFKVFKSIQFFDTFFISSPLELFHGALFSHQNGSFLATLEAFLATKISANCFCFKIDSEDLNFTYHGNFQLAWKHSW